MKTGLDNLNLFGSSDKGSARLWDMLRDPKVTQLVINRHDVVFYSDNLGVHQVDKLFVFYYLKFILKTDMTDINLDDIIYSLDLCDQNANFITINQDKAIIIEKDNYNIIVKEVRKPVEVERNGTQKNKNIEDDFLDDEFIVT